MDPLELKQRVQEVRDILTEARISAHTILDRIDGASVIGPGGVVMFQVKLGKVTSAPPASET